MKELNRILSFLLVTCLLVSALPAQALASEAEEPVVLTAEEEIEETTEPETEETVVTEESSAPETVAVVTASEGAATAIEDTESETITINTEPINKEDALCPENSMLIEETTDIIASGSCGESLIWKLDTNGLLTISGVGDMFGILDIGYDGFWRNGRNDYSEYIQYAVIEDGVTSISEHVFDNCFALKEVVMADSVTQIKSCAFQGCTVLKTIKLSENLVSLGLGAFNGCKSLEIIEIPSSLTSFEYNLFGGCTSLKAISIPNSITSIADGVFGSCENLSLLVIPESVRSIGNHLISGCKNNKKIVFLGDAPTFAKDAFYENSITAYYPEMNSSWTESVRQSYSGNVTWISYDGEYPNLDEGEKEIVKSGTCGENLTWILDEFGTLTISGTGYMKEYLWYGEDQSPWAKDQNIKTVVIENGVLNISSDAFCECINLTNVSIPNTVTRIGERAFTKCYNLVNIDIPDSVTVIKGSAFADCINLETIKLPKKMEVFCGFYGCRRLKNIEVPEGITKLETQAFSQCISLESVILPSTLEVIGYGAFQDCKKLTSVEIPNGVLVIEELAFCRCYNLERIFIPETVQVVGNNVFAHCKKLINVTIPEGVRVIYPGTFAGCLSMQSVSIPISVQTIQMGGFSDCEALSDVYFTGTESAWNQIRIEMNNEYLQSAKKHWGEAVLNDYSKLEYELQVTEGEHYNWSDRVVLPAFAQAFYDWLVESTDCDGENDFLINLENDGGHYLEPSGTTYWYNCKLFVKGKNRKELLINLEREKCAAIDAMQVAFSVFDHDHPGCIRLRGYGFSHSVKYLNDTTGQIEITFDLYLTSGEASEYYALQDQQNAAINSILSKIPSELSVYDQIRCFNSFLTKNNGYNTEQILHASSPDTAHYAITALTGNFGAEGPVCEGYAKAFKMLCDARGIPCEYIEGVTNTGTGHAWNAVQMEDGKWYVVDITANDPSTTTATTATSGLENQTYLLLGTESNVGGQKICETLFPWEYTLGLDFPNYPTLSETAYTPSTEKGHVEVIDKAKLPTCTESGLTEGSHCYICGKIFVEQTIIPPLSAAHEYKAEVIAPTCTEDGYTAYSCTHCSDSYVDTYVDALGHTGGTATCVDRAVCTRCEKAYGKLNKSNHIGETELMDIKEATCTEPGFTGNTYCVGCGAKIRWGQTIEAGHSFGPWMVTKKPTCTEKGEERRTCKRCTYYEAMVLDAEGHDHDITEILPTCTESGYSIYNCRCGDSYMGSEVPALGHTGGTATCKDQAICDRCEQAYGELNTTNHVGGTEVKNAKEATCTETGYTGDTHCKDCGTKLSSGQSVAVKGHSFDAWTQTKVPACTEKGSERRDCANCDHFETREVAAKGHDHKTEVTAPTCTEQGYTTHTCECGDSYVDTYVDALGHKFGEWEVIKVPTHAEKGSERRDCANCDHFEIREVDVLQTAPGDMNGDESVNDDDVILLLWHTLLPDMYPIEGKADFNADGSVNDEDVIYLLWHTLLPDMYPL